MMNIVFYILILIVVAIIYFLSSFLFEAIGSIAMKLVKKFKNNIIDEKENVDNE